MHAIAREQSGQAGSTIPITVGRADSRRGDVDGDFLAWRGQRTAAALSSDGDLRVYRVELDEGGDDPVPAGPLKTTALGAPGRRSIGVAVRESRGAPA